MLVISSCGNDNGGSGHDMAVAGSDLSGSVDDLAGTGGTGGTGGGGGDAGFVITDGGAVGTSCTTACDCLAGLGCFGGQCTQTNASNPVYCCGSTDCPTGSFCQSMNGQYGRCGGMTQQYDLSNFDPCPYIRCTTNNVASCTRAGCTMCIASSNGGGMVCAK